jgi:hypothetical protein
MDTKTPDPILTPRQQIAQSIFQDCLPFCFDLLFIVQNYMFEEKSKEYADKKYRLTMTHNYNIKPHIVIHFHKAQTTKIISSFSIEQEELADRAFQEFDLIATSVVKKRELKNHHLVLRNKSELSIRHRYVYSIVHNATFQVSVVVITYFINHRIPKGWIEFVVYSLAYNGAEMHKRQMSNCCATPENFGRFVEMVGMKEMRKWREFVFEGCGQKNCLPAPAMSLLFPSW